MAVTVYGDYGLTTPTSTFTDANGNLLVGTASKPGSVGNSLAYIVQGITAVNSGGTLPYFQTYTGTAGTDLKTWRHGGDGSGNYIFQTINDAYTTAAERVRVDSSGYMYSTPNSAGLGLVPGMMTYILNADNNLNGTLLTLQNPFGAATPTLQPGRYRYRLAMSFVKNTGTGQATYAMGGTATVSYAAHNIYTRAGATFQTTASPVFQFITTTTPTVSVAITGNTTAVAQDTIVSDGYIDVSVAGTVFFGVGFSSAPGTSTAGSYRFVQGSYVEIWPVSVTGANTNIGGWA